MMHHWTTISFDPRYDGALDPSGFRHSVDAPQDLGRVRLSVSAYSLQLTFDGTAAEAHAWLTAWRDEFAKALSALAEVAVDAPAGVGGIEPVELGA